MPGDPITFWRSDGQAYMRLLGKGSALNSGTVKAFAKEIVRRGYDRFVVDLGECTGMDETFMGTLLDMALKLRERGGGGVQIVRCPSALNRKFAYLGIDCAFQF